jgi:death-on-curing protein
MEVFLVLNSAEIEASVDDQEDLMLKVAAGEVTREVLVQWLERHICDSK